MPLDAHTHLGLIGFRPSLFPVGLRGKSTIFRDQRQIPLEVGVAHFRQLLHCTYLELHVIECDMTSLAHPFITSDSVVLSKSVVYILSRRAK